MIGERLKEERERLGFNQPAFAELAGAKKRTLIDWEKGVSSPTALQLAALMENGVDVPYVLMGERDPTSPKLDVTEMALLANFRQCKPDAKANVIQMVALLSAGLSPGATTRGTGTSLSMTGGKGNVQIGGGGGTVNKIKRDK